jgi:hypothetical protein
MPRFRAAALIAVALAAAAALALLADAVFSVDRNIRSADARLAAGLPLEPPESEGFRFRAAETLLGAADDRDYREALALLQRNQPVGSPEETLALHGLLEARLGSLARDGGSPQLRSSAANVNGILLYEDARLDRRSAIRYFELSLGAFREAVRHDPENEDAKYNLELLVRLIQEQQQQPGRERSGDTGSTGAGVSPEGSGY